MNQITLVGRISSIDNQNSKPDYTLFSIAVRKSEKVAYGEPTADFFNCIVFGKTKEIFEKYTKVGHMIAVSGRMKTKKWTDKNDPSRKAIFYTVNVNSLSLIESKSKSEETQQESHHNGF